MIEIFFFAHGTTPENEQQLLSGWNDIGLSDLGKKQAVELGQHFNFTTFPAVYCSDLPRATQTVELACGSLERVQTDPRLREVNFGTFTSRPSSLINDHWTQYINAAFPEGESYLDVEKRICEFLNDLGKQSHQKIALVAHQAPQLALEVLLNGKTWQQAMEEDWRNTGDWHPGWKYEMHKKGCSEMLQP